MLCLQNKPRTPRTGFYSRPKYFETVYRILRGALTTKGGTVTSQIAQKNNSSLNEAVLDFGSIYNKYFTKISQRLAKLDRLSGFTRSADQNEELTQSFFAKVWEKKILNSFDPSKTQSKDPILTFLNNHVRTFFKNLKEREVREAKVISDLKLLGFKNGSDSTLYGNVHFEDHGFCHDIKKVSKAFVRSLKGLERRVYRLFKDQILDADPKQIALQLGVSQATSYRLKESIQTKAREYLGGYYSGNINFN